MKSCCTMLIIGLMLGCAGKEQKDSSIESEPELLEHRIETSDGMLAFAYLPPQWQREQLPVGKPFDELSRFKIGDKDVFLASMPYLESDFTVSDGYQVLEQLIFSTQHDPGVEIRVLETGVYDPAQPSKSATQEIPHFWVGSNTAMSEVGNSRRLYIVFQAVWLAEDFERRVVESQAMVDAFFSLLKLPGIVRGVVPDKGS